MLIYVSAKWQFSSLSGIGNVGFQSERFFLIALYPRMRHNVSINKKWTCVINMFSFEMSGFRITLELRYSGKGLFSTSFTK